MTARPSPWLQFDSELQVHGVVDAAAEKLREAVLRGSLLPGTAVTEALVATRFSIARPSAKAAIEKLTAEGLLERSANRSARVLRIDVESVHDIYQTRRRLESAALRELAERCDAPARALAANVQIRAMSSKHPSEIIEHDLEFHLAIVDALSSRRMSGLYRRILSEVRLCMGQVQGRRLLQNELIGDEHSRILDALHQGQGELAVNLLKIHLERAERLLAEAVFTSRRS